MPVKYIKLLSLNKGKMSKDNSDRYSIALDIPGAVAESHPREPAGRIKKVLDSTRSIPKLTTLYCTTPNYTYFLIKYI